MNVYQSQDAVICPYCLHKHEDTDDYVLEADAKCEKCGKGFLVDAIVIFQTRKVEEDAQMA